MTPIATQDPGSGTTTKKPQVMCLDVADPSITTEKAVSIIRRDGGVIIRGLIPIEVTKRIQRELQPVYDADVPDGSGFFPTTTKRATGLVAASDGFIEFATNKLWIDVCNSILTSTFQGWHDETLMTWTSKPIISSTVGFQIPPGSKAQVLHRDDADWHSVVGTDDVMMGCLLAISRSTAENGATMVIPGSHHWGNERAPKRCEAVAAELEPGDVLMFHAGIYHGGGANKTTNELREVVGVFMNKGWIRPAENQTLAAPPEVAKRFTPQVQRLLGYGISFPGVGFYQYKDPMQVLFNVVDEETAKM
ncbi:hypothetical protein E8E14_000169 [Neopestalotiopsis sp. 37M]|nr:hypothetical protein E8E14_000169 [Neopestalotiopsis sp. 37M]